MKYSRSNTFYPKRGGRKDRNALCDNKMLYIKGKDGYNPPPPSKTKDTRLKLRP